MDLKLFGLLLIFLIAVMLPEDECWGRRRRRWRFRIRVPRIRIPRIRLPRIRLPRIRIPVPRCKYVCGIPKRGIDDDISQTNRLPGHLTPTPRNFDFYDLNDDKFITIDEIEQLFKLADTNNDGKLSLDEFGKYSGDLDDDDDQGEDGNPGQGGGDGNQGQGGDDGNPGNKGNNPGQRSIEFDEE